jgi:hypothetical protein
MKNVPWWFHLARLGHSVGVGIGAVAGLSIFLPPQLSVPIGAVAGLATVVTHYADKGVASVNE